MNSKMKTFGLALVAVLALGALAAPSALATAKKFRAEQSAVLTGENTTLTELEFPGTGVTSCGTETYQATVTTESSEIVVTPAYSECSTNGVHTILEMNGCTFAFTLHTGTTSTGEATTHTHGPMHIVCPAGQEITKTITVFGFNVCTVHVPPQTPTSPTVDYKNKGTGPNRDIEMSYTVTGVTAVATNTGGGCTAGVHHNGILRGSITFRAYKLGKSHTAENQVGIWEQ